MAPNDPRPRRRPRRVYDEGTEPDPRFSLANERTLLAWLRTSLALMAAGVGVEALANATRSGQGPARTALALGLLATGVLVSSTAFARWMATERALRTGRPLPTPRLGAFLGSALAVAGVIACVLLVTAEA